MSASREYRDYVMERLAQAGEVRARSLFGEVGLYSGEVLFGMIVGDELLFKTDSESKADYEAEGAVPFVAPWNPGKPTAYYPVPASILDDPARLGGWINKSVAAAASTHKARKKG